MEASQKWIICLIFKNGDREFFTVTEKEYFQFREKFYNENSVATIIKHAFGETAFAHGQIVSFEATLEGKDETIKRLNSIVAPDLHMALEVVLKRLIAGAQTQLASNLIDLTRKVEYLQEKVCGANTKPTSPARTNTCYVAPRAEKTEAERLKDILKA
jgi:hypothetical protein